LQGYSINGTEKYLCAAALIITVAVIAGGILIYIGKYRTVLYHPAGRNDSRIEEALSFGRGGKKIVKERIEMMLNSKSRKKGWQIFSGVLLSFLVVMVSSMTTLAYQPPAVLELEGSEKEVEHEHGEVMKLKIDFYY
jgi:hypothetical protein